MLSYKSILDKLERRTLPKEKVSLPFPMQYPESKVQLKGEIPGLNQKQTQSILFLHEKSKGKNVLEFYYNERIYCLQVLEFLLVSFLDPNSHYHPESKIIEKLNVKELVLLNQKEEKSENILKLKSDNEKREQDLVMEILLLYFYQIYPSPELSYFVLENLPHHDLSIYLFIEVLNLESIFERVNGKTSIPTLFQNVELLQKTNELPKSKVQLFVFGLYLQILTGSPNWHLYKMDQDLPQKMIQYSYKEAMDTLVQLPKEGIIKKSILKGLCNLSQLCSPVELTPLLIQIYQDPQISENFWKIEFNQDYSTQYKKSQAVFPYLQSFIQLSTSLIQTKLSAGFAYFQLQNLNGYCLSTDYDYFEGKLVGGDNINLYRKGPVNSVGRSAGIVECQFSLWQYCICLIDEYLSTNCNFEHTKNALDLLSQFFKHCDGEMLEDFLDHTITLDIIKTNQYGTTPLEIILELNSELMKRKIHYFSIYKAFVKFDAISIWNRLRTLKPTDLVSYLELCKELIVEYTNNPTEIKQKYVVELLSNLLKDVFTILNQQQVSNLLCDIFIISIENRIDGGVLVNGLCNGPVYQISPLIEMCVQKQPNALQLLLLLIKNEGTLTQLCLNKTIKQQKPIEFVQQLAMFENDLEIAKKCTEILTIIAEKRVSLVGYFGNDVEQIALNFIELLGEHGACEALVKVSIYQFVDVCFTKQPGLAQIFIEQGIIDTVSKELKNNEHSVLSACCKLIDTIYQNRQTKTIEKIRKAGIIDQLQSLITQSNVGWWWLYFKAYAIRIIAIEYFHSPSDSLKKSIESQFPEIQLSFDPELSNQINSLSNEYNIDISHYIKPKRLEWFELDRHPGDAYVYDLRVAGREPRIVELLQKFNINFSNTDAEIAYSRARAFAIKILISKNQLQDQKLLTSTCQELSKYTQQSEIHVMYRDIISDLAVHLIKYSKADLMNLLLDGMMLNVYPLGPVGQASTFAFHENIFKAMLILLQKQKTKVNVLPIVCEALYYTIQNHNNTRLLDILLSLVYELTRGSASTWWHILQKYQTPQMLLEALSRWTGPIPTRILLILLSISQAKSNQLVVSDLMSTFCNNPYTPSLQTDTNEYDHFFKLQLQVITNLLQTANQELVTFCVGYIRLYSTCFQRTLDTNLNNEKLGLIKAVLEVFYSLSKHLDNSHVYVILQEYQDSLLAILTFVIFLFKNPHEKNLILPEKNNDQLLSICRLIIFCLLNTTRNDSTSIFVASMITNQEKVATIGILFDLIRTQISHDSVYSIEATITLLTMQLYLIEKEDEQNFNELKAEYESMVSDIKSLCEGRKVGDSREFVMVLQNFLIK
ncbi:hypothetical protein HDV06_007178 [Boothiomyces sp. JEL0866]|nr:hypothetical protein HDV06_007178 [Boothiomyces sp. JEL0866]